MKKNLIIPLATIIVLYLGCSKSNNSDNGPKNNTPAPVKIEIVSGSGQADTVGLQLANLIVVKVTQNGNPVAGYNVEFQGSGCNQDLTLIETTQADGTTSYVWRLAGDVGQQTVKAYALNAQNQKVDSATATGTGIAPGPGWHNSACSIVGGLTVAAICKLSTGKLFACYPGKAYMRYSDDNGASWYAVTNLGNSHFFTWVQSSYSDELYAFAINEGIFYSKDAGQTWTQLSSPPFSTANISAGICTPNGKLIITTPGDVSVSLDKGQTWARTPSSGFPVPGANGGDDEDFGSPTEDKSGNLYVAGREGGTIYESTDNGGTWSAISKPQGEDDFGFYVDNNNWYYKVIGGSPNAGLYLSKDNGATYTELFSAPFYFLHLFSIQSDGNYYFENVFTGLYQSTGITASVKLISSIRTQTNAPYIVAKNGNVVTGYDGNLFITYLNK